MLCGGTPAKHHAQSTVSAHERYLLDFLRRVIVVAVDAALLFFIQEFKKQLQERPFLEEAIGLLLHSLVYIVEPEVGILLHLVDELVNDPLRSYLSLVQGYEIDVGARDKGREHVFPYLAIRHPSEFVFLITPILDRISIRLYL